MSMSENMTREEWAETLREWADVSEEERIYVRLEPKEARRIAWLLHAVGPSQPLGHGCESTAK